MIANEPTPGDFLAEWMEPMKDLSPAMEEMLVEDVEAAAPAFGFTLPASVAELRAALLAAAAECAAPTPQGEWLSGMPEALTEERLGYLDWLLRNRLGEEMPLDFDNAAHELWGHVLYLRALLRGQPPASPADGPATAPHVRGSETSKAAARALAPKLAGKRLALLQVIMKKADSVRGVGVASDPAWGFIDNWLIRVAVDLYNWSANTPRARRVELARAGWLEDSGERRDGSTVWRPTAKAWAWWREQQNGGGE